MRGLTKNVVIAAAILVPGGLAAQGASHPPVCSGELDGAQLTTTIRFTNGYTVVAPWRITGNRPVSQTPGRQVMVNLDRIVERDPASGQTVTTPFANPIEATFEGADMDEVVEQAAQVWCVTVMRVRGEGKTLDPKPALDRALPMKITALPLHGLPTG